MLRSDSFLQSPITLLSAIRSSIIHWGANLNATGPTVKPMGVMTLRKHPQTVDVALQHNSVSGAPEMFTVSCADLAAAIRAELVEFFHDGVSPTLGQYAVDHIVGGTIQRVAAVGSLGGNPSVQTKSNRLC
jgi:hypothetical protein